MSCNSPARLAILGFKPSSEDMIPHNLATSLECCKRFWPYDDLYFILPTAFINVGFSPWIPKSITVLFPTSTISFSISFFVFLTTSSILAGWILPSVTSLCRESLATSLLTESKQDKIIASGVSSTIISTPVADSIALILRPSLPIILPLTSSDSILKTETQLSIASSVPTLWIVLITIFLASCLAESFASSIIFCVNSNASVLASCLRDSTNSFLASSADIVDNFSSFSTCSLCSLTTSIFFFSSWSNFLSKDAILSFKLWLFFLFIESSLETWDSLSFILFWISVKPFSLFSMCFSCSDFSSKNLSLAWNILSFFIFSPSILADLRILFASFLAFCIDLFIGGSYDFS